MRMRPTEVIVNESLISEVLNYLMDKTCVKLERFANFHPHIAEHICLGTAHVIELAQKLESLSLDRINVHSHFSVSRIFAALITQHPRCPSLLSSLHSWLETAAKALLP
jgi:hypothetical protein